MTNWPKPVNHPSHLSLWEKGRFFLLQGGPYDGLQVRLWPQVLAGTETSGWDEVSFDGVRYIRPQHVDPYANPQSKAKQKLPVMVHVEGS